MEKIFKLIKSLFLMDIWSIYITETSLHKFFNSKGKILFLKKKKFIVKNHLFLLIHLFLKKVKKRLHF